MVSGRAHVTEHARGATRMHQLGGEDGCARRAPRRVPGVRIHAGVGVDGGIALLRGERLHLEYVRVGVRSIELLESGGGRFVGSCEIE